MNFFDKNSIYYAKWGIQDYVANLSRIKSLRKNYKYFPYLYAYDEEEETIYHKNYMKAGQRLDAIVALCDNEIIGISIGCPLIQDIAICADLVSESYNNKTTYYFGDIIIDKKYWGQGIANSLYDTHINHVSEKEFKHILALLITREINDPRKPRGFKKSNLWKLNGFEPTNFTVQYPWRTYTTTGEIEEEVHKLQVHKKTF